MYISRKTGQEITELEHVVESLIDILTTRKRLRILRCEYGCDIYSLIDQPMTAELAMSLRIAIVDAITLWEPRLTLTSIQINVDSWPQGVLSIDLNAVYKPTGKEVSFNTLELRYRSIEDE